MSQSVPLGRAIESKRLLGAAYTPYPRQREILGQVERCTRSVLCLGRRSGKSCGVIAPFMVWRATCCPHLDEHVQRGEEVRHEVVATKQDQARLVITECVRLVQASPVLRAMVRRSDAYSIDFDNGHRIIAAVCSGRTERGPAIATLALDELAWFYDESDGPAVAEAVHRALVPATTQFGPDRRVILSSTPNGNNFFRRQFDEARAAAESGDENTIAVQAATWEVNPRITREALDAERRSLGPDFFEAEFAAQFVAGRSALFAESDLLDAVRPGGELDPTEGTSWTVGADLAWRRDPSAAVVVGPRNGGDPGHLTVAAVRRYEPPDVTAGHERYQEFVIAEIADLARRYAAHVYVDTYESATVVERFRRHGVSCFPVAMGTVTREDGQRTTGKASIFGELARRVRSGTVTWPDHDVLLGELRRIRAEYRGNRIVVSNPRTSSGHGDVAQALAVAVAMHAAADEQPAAAGPGLDRMLGLALPADPMAPISGSEFGA